MALSRVRLSSSVTGEKLPNVKPFKEQGRSGTAVYAGYVVQRDKATDWQRGNRYRISSEIMVNTSIVAASVRHFLNLIAHPQWTVNPSDKDDAEAVELAEFMDDVIHDMSTEWSRVIRRCGTFQFHGFGIQEWTMKKRADGLIGLKDIESRPQHTIERWDVDVDGGVLGVWQRSPQDQQLYGLPRGKLVYLVDDTMTDSPEGLGIFRQLLEPYNRLKEYLQLENKAFERDLRGTPIGRAPLSALRQAVANGQITETVAEQLIEGMKDFVKLQVKQSTTGMLLDSQPYESTAADGPKVSPVMQWGMELLQGSSNGLPELSHAIDRIQREIARIIGTEHLMMGDAGGNRALSADKSRNLYLVANSVLGQIVAAMDRDIIEPIWAVNGFPEEKKPYFSAEDVAFKDAEAVAATLRDMASAGAVLAVDDPAIDDVRDLLGVARAESMGEMMASETGPVNTGQQMEDESVDNEAMSKFRKIRRVRLSDNRRR